MKRLVLENFLPYRLNRLAAAISREFRSVYGPHHDLTVPEWRVLATLGEYDHMGAKDIGLHSAMHKTKVSRAVRALEERRWLTRTTHPEDRREEILALTSLGKHAYSEIVPEAVLFEQQLMDGLGKEAEIVLAAIKRLEKRLDLKKSS